MKRTDVILQASDSTELFVRVYEPVQRDLYRSRSKLTRSASRGKAEKTVSDVFAGGITDSGVGSQIGNDRTIVIIHGTSEYGGRYEHVVPLFTEHGWRVIIADQRGHGRSGGVRTHVRRFDAYLSDLDVIWDTFHLGSENTVLVGHSFGGLVAIRYAQTRPERIAKLVLLSPLLGLKVRIDALTLIFGRVMSWVAPRVRFRSRVDPNCLTRNREALLHRENDPYIHRSVTAGWFFQMKSALRYAWQQAERIRIPVLALQPARDEVVDPHAVEPWLRRIRAEERTLRIFDEHYHELLSEPDWRETAAAIMEWISNDRRAESRKRRAVVDEPGSFTNQGISRRRASSKPEA